MLDNKTIQLVQSTAPVLKQHSHAIGKKFYELLFSKAPDLYNLFNQTNQKRGIQQEALAYAVYAAGENITKLEALKPMIRRITEKHRAIGVNAAQYPVVGETLLQAVKDVLGDAATDEILDAWGQAYSYIADAFIEIEKNLYQQAEHQPGGWEGYRSFSVDKKVKESEDVTSFYLKASDRLAAAAFKAGQYLTLKADIPGERYKHIRHYSLSDSPDNDYYRISVKREDSHGDEPDGIVSNYLHEQVQLGDTLDFSAPAGDFILNPGELPVVLISGGIGITPLLSMLNTIADRQPLRQVTFVHATTNSRTHAFKEQMAEMEEKNPNIKCYVCYGSPAEEDRTARNYDKEGRIDLNWLQSIHPSKDAEFYFCGPISFMKAVNNMLKEWGVSMANIHYEVFNPVAILDEE